jgi:hypothetical protein
MILVRIREGAKFDKIPVQILTPGVKSGSAINTPGHTAHGVTRHEATRGQSGTAAHASRSRGARSGW